MTRRDRIVGWLVAALFGATPGLVLAAQLCVGCCCPPTPCHGGDPVAACATEIARAPCCDERLPVLPSAAKRSSDAPLFEPSAVPRWLPVARPRVAAVRIAPDAGARSSPLRLSVVLRI